MRKILLLVFTIITAFVGFSQNTNITSFYEGPFEDVLNESKRINKPIFLDFTSKTCKHCLKMTKEIFANQSIAENLNTNFIGYKVDIEGAEGKAIVQKYDINEFPAFILLDSKAKTIGKIQGLYQANQFLKELNRLMTNPSQTKPPKKRFKLFG